MIMESDNAVVGKVTNKIIMELSHTMTIILAQLLVMILILVLTS
jgi:hypothetical protein